MGQGDTPAGPSAALARPASQRAMFMSFTRLALQGFGGVLPVAQREIVERRRWLDRDQFLEMLSVAQVLPGPNIVNLSLMIGDRFFGWRGAVTAMAGVLLAPLVLVLALAWLAQQVQGMPGIDGALRGMSVAASGLVLSTAWRLSGALRKNALGLPTCAVLGTLTLLAVGLLRWPMVNVVLGLGSLSCLLAWRRLSA